MQKARFPAALRRHEVPFVISQGPHLHGHEPHFIKHVQIKEGGTGARLVALGALDLALGGLCHQLKELFLGHHGIVELDVRSRLEHLAVFIQKLH